MQRESEQKMTEAKMQKGSFARFFGFAKKSLPFFFAFCLLLSFTLSLPSKVFAGELEDLKNIAADVKTAQTEAMNEGNRLKAENKKLYDAYAADRKKLVDNARYRGSYGLQGKKYEPPPEDIKNKWNPYNLLQDLQGAGTTVLIEKMQREHEEWEANNQALKKADSQFRLLKQRYEEIEANLTAYEAEINKPQPNKAELDRLANSIKANDVLAKTNRDAVLTAEQHSRLALERKRKEDAGKCLSGVTLNMPVCINEVLAGIGNVVMALFALLLAIAGGIWDWTVNGTIVNMGKTFGALAGPINEAWASARDVANIFFIFILLYLAIETILGIGHDTKHAVVRIIVMAVLINFSLFFTKVIIDSSNIVAIAFYNQIQVAVNKKAPVVLAAPKVGGSIEQGARYLSNTAENAVAGTIAGAFMKVLNFQQFYKPGADIGFWKIIYTTILGSFTMFTTAMIFFASVYVLAGRVVTFMLCMVFSPLAFASMAMPHDKYSERYWEPLINNAIFAPLYMMFLWLSIKIMLSDGFSTFLQKTNSNVSLSLDKGALDNLGSLLGLGTLFPFLYGFIIVNAFAMASLLVASDLGIAGGEDAVKWVNEAKGAFTSTLGAGLVRGSGIRKLDEYIGRTQLGNTMAGNALRSVTTGQLVNMKFGGHHSAKDLYEESKHLKATRERLGQEKEVDKALNDDYSKQPNPELAKDRAIRAALQKMSGSSVVEMLNADESKFHKEDIMRNLTSSQFATIQKNDKIHQDHKDHAVGARFGNVTRSLDKLKEDREAWDKAHNDGTIDDKTYLDPDKMPSLKAINASAALQLREITPSDAEFLAKDHPEIVSNGILTPNLKQGPVNGLAKSDFLDEETKKGLKITKNYGLVEGKFMAFGANTSSKAFKDMMGPTGDKEVRKDIEKGLKKFQRNTNPLEAYITDVDTRISAATDPKKRASLLRAKQTAEAMRLPAGRNVTEWQKAGAKKISTSFRGKGPEEYSSVRDEEDLTARPLVRGYNKFHLSTDLTKLDAEWQEEITQTMFEDWGKKDLSADNQSFLMDHFDPVKESKFAESPQLRQHMIDAESSWRTRVGPTATKEGWLEHIRTSILNNKLP